MTLAILAGAQVLGRCFAASARLLTTKHGKTIDEAGAPLIRTVADIKVLSFMMASREVPDSHVKIV